MSDATKTFEFGRRGLLLGSASVAASSIAMPYIGNAAAAEPIKIGMIWAKTGQIVDQAEYLAQGGMLALEQRNNMLLGRPAEIVWLDEPNPQGAQQSAERLVGEHKVAGIVGGALSSFALAISAVAKKSKTPYIAANAAAGAITGSSCNKYTFRLQPPVDVHTNVLAPYCASLGKKWYLLTASYAFGQDIKKAFTDYITAHGGTVVGADEAPVNTADYSSFILKIRAAKPDVVIGGISASDLTTFLKQWNELGMRGKIPFAEIAVGNTDLWGVGPEAADGLFTLTWYYKNPNNPPEEQAMAAAYEK
ncbi:MAG: amino acid ABC transporter substrate-binding protein, partial [Hyphomicrobiales bacterium]|nr:amino acid ABC transporter substrate-binding protein [Hyphomicrobiales bacterium]